MLDAHLRSRDFRALVQRALPDEPTKCVLGYTCYASTCYGPTYYGPTYYSTTLLLYYSTTLLLYHSTTLLL